PFNSARERRGRVVVVASVMAWILDLDGVVWRGEQPVVGAATAIARLRARGERVLFVTNNSAATVAQYIDKLVRHGIDTPGDALCTSAQAAATLVDAGERALVCGGPGIVEALEARGAETVEDGHADAVVVGWH